MGVSFGIRSRKGEPREDLRDAAQGRRPIDFAKGVDEIEKADR